MFEIIVIYYAELLWIGGVGCAALAFAIALVVVPEPRRNRRLHTVGRRLVASGQLRRMK